ncbi:lysozyme inhibitor LprI family protein, partial [Microvirga soli]|uniref:lysozyme inhibitor LprI family protein n=1 Tax=Microvirga soli TaxID=1854496 RepID=UPI001FE7E0B4
MRYLPVALLAMLAVSSTASAEDDCEGETQYEMNMCAGRRFDKADKAMNERYTVVREELSGGLSHARCGDRPDPTSNR